LLKKDEDSTWKSIHLRFEQLKSKNLNNNEQFWNAHIAELQQQPMSGLTGDSKTRAKIKLVDYLQKKVQNVECQQHTRRSTSMVSLDQQFGNTTNKIFGARHIWSSF
jgi:hypothetical protein